MGQTASNNNKNRTKKNKDNALHKYLKNDKNYLKDWAIIQDDIKGLFEKNEAITLNDLDADGNTSLHIIIIRLSHLEQSRQMMYLCGGTKYEYRMREKYDEEETCINILKDFLSAGTIDLTTKDNQGNIPLHLLCHLPKPDIDLLDIMITKMIASGCELNVRNINEQTPFDLIFCEAGVLRRENGVLFSDCPGKDEKAIALVKGDSSFIPLSEEVAGMYFVESKLCKFYAIELLAKKGILFDIKIPDTHKDTKIGCFVKMWQMRDDSRVILRYLLDAYKETHKRNKDFLTCLSKNQKNSFATFFNSVKTSINGKVPKVLMKLICQNALLDVNDKEKEQFISVDIKECFENFELAEFKSAFRRMANEIDVKMIDEDQLSSSFNY